MKKTAQRALRFAAAITTLAALALPVSAGAAHASGFPYRCGNTSGEDFQWWPENVGKDIYLHEGSGYCTGSPLTFELVLQGDGNLVIYNSSGRALWASNTDIHNQTQAVMQTDGNFVVYSGGRARGPPAPGTAARTCASRTTGTWSSTRALKSAVTATRSGPAAPDRPARRLLRRRPRPVSHAPQPPAPLRAARTGVCGGGRSGGAGRVRHHGDHRRPDQARDRAPPRRAAEGKPADCNDHIPDPPGPSDRDQ